MALVGVWTATSEVQIGAGQQVGLAPPFWQTERDRLTAEASGALDLHPARLSLHLDGWRRDRYPDGRVVSGPGDLTLGAEVDLWRGLGAVWLVKLPNAEDEEQLGTDEADITLLARAQLGEAGGWQLSAWGGAVVRGDPRLYLTQDVAPITHLVVGREGAAAGGRLRLGGAWASATNPAALEVALSGRVPLGSFSLGAEASAGLTPAAPGWGGRLWLGWGRARIRSPRSR